MKIVRPSLNILLDKIKTLDAAEGILKDRNEVYNNMNLLLDQLANLNGSKTKMQNAASAWIEQQKWRDEGYAVDQYHVSIVRERLEVAITEYRKTLADVYDFMGDKGLV